MTRLLRWAPCLLRLVFPVLPMGAGIVLLLATGSLVGEYRASVEPRNGLSPAFPRAGFPFRVSLPGSDASGLEPATLLLVKERSGPYFPGLWQDRRTVLEVPILLENERSAAVLGLHDPGVYRLTVVDQKTGKALLSRQVRVTVPGSLLRNELLLFTLLAIGGTISGQRAGKALRPVRGFLSLPVRTLLFWGIMEISVILVFAGMTHRSAVDPPAITLSRVLPLRQDFLPKNGLLTIRRRIMEEGISDWSRFGKEETIFSGQIDLRRIRKKGFLLSPGPGVTTFSLVSPDHSGKILSEFQRGILLSADSPFPGLVFFGMVLFSGAFFLRSVASP